MSLRVSYYLVFAASSLDYSDQSGNTLVYNAAYLQARAHMHVPDHCLFSCIRETTRLLLSQMLI